MRERDGPADDEGSAVVKAGTGGAAPCDFVLRGAAELVTMSGTRRPSA